MAAPFLRRGWGQAVLGSILTVLAALALGELFAVLLFAGGAVPGLTLGTSLRVGWALVYVFHHAALELQTPVLHLPHGSDLVAGLPFGYRVDATVAFGLLGGTALVAWMLMRAGARTADAAGATGLTRGFQGAKIALPYGLLMFLSSWPLQFRIKLPDTGPFDVHPSHLAALVWPVIFGLVFGFLGGLRASWREVWTSDWWESDRWSRRLRGSFAGGIRMVVIALLLSFAGLLALAVARPHDTGLYFHLVFRAGVVNGIALLVLSILALPNAALYVLVPAMGGCLEVGGFSPFCFLSYLHFPGHFVVGPPNPSGFPNLGQAPAAYFVFLLAPIVATVAGGWLAARRAAVRGPTEGLGVGIMAGVVFGLILLVLLMLSVLNVWLNGPIFYVATGFYRYGPNPIAGLQQGLAWGILGGAAGGVFGGLRRARAPASATPLPQDARMAEGAESA